MNKMHKMRFFFGGG